MSNFPPGVTLDMIPGNRPEDEAWEQWAETLDLRDIAENMLCGFEIKGDSYRIMREAIVEGLEKMPYEDLGSLGASLGCNDDFETWCSGRGDYERGRFDNLVD